MAKQLKPTLRERNRYLVFRVESNGKFERKPVVDAIWSSLLRLHGEVGASKTSLWVMDWDKAKGKGILKVNHKSVEVVASSIVTVKEIGKSRAVVTVEKTAGSLRKARESL